MSRNLGLISPIPADSGRFTLARKSGLLSQAKLLTIHVRGSGCHTSMASRSVFFLVLKIGDFWMTGNGVGESRILGSMES